MSTLTIEQAKERLTIHDLWRRLDLPGEPKVSCKSPFREESKPSFSVSADSRLWNDFSTGEGGDAIDFYQKATGLSRRETCCRFLEMAGGRVCSPLPVIKRLPVATKVRELPSLPAMRRGTPAELEALAHLRSLDPWACRIADGAGFLRFGTWRGQAAWFITDKEGKNAQARRMDGQPWEGINAKAQTLPGSWADWPLGITSGEYQTLCLVEGGLDLLAACHFIYQEGREMDCCPVAMLGASMRISQTAIPLFAGKRVRIFSHADEAGRKAARRWGEQLTALSATVDAVDFTGLRKSDGSPVKDLNDCTSIHPDDAGELVGILPS